MLRRTFFHKIGEIRGWKYTRDAVYGFDRGYWVIFLSATNERVIMIDFDVADKTKIENVVSMMVENSKELKIKHICITEYGFVISSDEFWSVVNYRRFQSILDFTINLLIRFDIPSTNTMRELID